MSSFEDLLRNSSHLKQYLPLFASEMIDLLRLFKLVQDKEDFRNLLKGMGIKLGHILEFEELLLDKIKADPQVLEPTHSSGLKSFLKLGN